MGGVFPAHFFCLIAFFGWARQGQQGIGRRRESRERMREETKVLRAGGFQAQAGRGKVKGKGSTRSAGRPVGASRASSSGASVGGSASSSVGAPAAPHTPWRETVASTVTGLGYELVEIDRVPGGTLRITIDRIPGRAYPAAPGDFVTVDDCEAVTRQLQYALEIDALSYTRLEVSSPGLDRPLLREADYERFAGIEVSVTLKEAFQGRKVWKGVLERSDADQAGTAGTLGMWTLTLADAKPPTRSPCASGAQGAGRRRIDAASETMGAAS